MQSNTIIQTQIGYIICICPKIDTALKDINTKMGLIGHSRIRSEIRQGQYGFVQEIWRRNAVFMIRIR